LFCTQSVSNETLGRLVTVARGQALAVAAYTLALLFGLAVSALALWGTVARRRGPLQAYAASVGVVGAGGALLLALAVYGEREIGDGSVLARLGAFRLVVRWLFGVWDVASLFSIRRLFFICLSRNGSTNMK
jgi:hypothetical protein